MSAYETVEDYLRRLERLHERTNCIADVDADAALRAARDLDERWPKSGPAGLLHGVPFTVKDWIDAAGLRCSGGQPATRERRPERDATVVAKMRAAGAVLMAKTTVQVESECFGVVRNPHDPARSPGASSSGEAAAVGGGGSPFGLASDSGGSIRVPAAWCGAAGLKPTAGRVSLAGHFPRLADRGDGRTQIGPIARTAADLALLLPLLAGPDGVDPAVVPGAAHVGGPVELATLRVARATALPGWPASPQVTAALDDALAALEARGARRVDDFDLRLDEALDITRRYWGRRRLSGQEADGQLRDWDHYRWSMFRAIADIDVLIAPVTAGPAPQHRAMADEDYVYTLPASLTGWPAATVPVGWHGGLPIGVQIIAAPWREDVVLTVAACVECYIAPKDAAIARSASA